MTQPGAGGWFWLAQQQGEPQEEGSKNTAGGCECTAGKSWLAQASSPRNKTLHKNTGGLAAPEAALTRQWPQTDCCSGVTGDPTAPSSVQALLGTAGGSHVRTTIFAKLTPCAALLLVVSLAKPLCREQAQKASVYREADRSQHPLSAPARPWRKQPDPNRSSGWLGGDQQEAGRLPGLGSATPSLSPGPAYVKDNVLLVVSPPEPQISYPQQPGPEAFSDAHKDSSKVHARTGKEVGTLGCGSALVGSCNCNLTPHNNL